ncbi:MAG: Holliday junction branch migration protein RuvA [Tannerella sp.]|jgi:Holliday junction DNA helicase RuvA|nr:Holliday junction branch migration protein RuvA [Tannerella sp.]
MIEYIRGEIVELSPTQMIMDCNGIGYELNISVTTYSAFNGQREGKIFVYEIIREDAHLLYGFASREERELFLLLTSVSGVGPNTARMILSSLPPSELIQAIASGDDVSLTRIKGIGSKTAQRILVDLRNKVKTVEGMSGRSKLSAAARSEISEGAVAALVMLGFQKAASQKAVDAILKNSPSSSVEQVIKDALKIL